MGESVAAPGRTTIADAAEDEPPSESALGDAVAESESIAAPEPSIAVAEVEDDAEAIVESPAATEPAEAADDDREDGDGEPETDSETLAFADADADADAEAKAKAKAKDADAEAKDADAEAKDADAEAKDADADDEDADAEDEDAEDADGAEAEDADADGADAEDEGGSEGDGEGRPAGLDKRPDVYHWILTPVTTLVVGPGLAATIGLFVAERATKYPRVCAPVRLVNGCEETLLRIAAEHTVAFLVFWLLLWAVPWWRGLRSYRMALAVVTALILIALPLRLIATIQVGDTY